MAARSFEEMYGRTLTIDLCETCQGLWFDGTELLKLSPGATLELFRTVAGSPPPRAALAGSHACPHCSRRLVEASDLQNTTRFFFERCPGGHGRYMTFFQFLRAKRFVRSLTDAEVRRLKDAVRQVNCSNCGAPLDIDRSPSCGHCGTPVSMLDPAQLEATARRLSDEDARRKAGDPVLPLTLAMERLRTERAFAALDPGALRSTPVRESSPVDLVLLGLDALKKVLGS
jgi:hypothetical protein